MIEHPSTVLMPWANFYIMTGSSASALTGLMFVVITLVNRVNRSQTNDGIATFSTPTVLHFCAALLVSGTIVAPWPSLLPPATLLGVAGSYGVAHVLRAMYRAQRLSTYDPDLSDLISYTALPLLAYGAILGGAIALPFGAVGALFAIAAGAVLLLFIGIRNAWDIVTYIVIGGAGTPPESDSAPTP